MPSLTADLNFERGGRGEPMVLLHGIGGELCVWEPVLEPLAEWLDVIAVDLPGFGHSPPLAGGAAPTPAALAAAIARLMDALGIASAHLGGNSLGAWGLPTGTYTPPLYCDRRSRGTLCWLSRPLQTPFNLRGLRTSPWSASARSALGRAARCSTGSG